MPKQDDITEEKGRVANNVSHSKRRTKTRKECNLQTKRFKINGKTVKLRIKARTLRTIAKKGLSAVLKKYKVSV